MTDPLLSPIVIEAVKCTPGLKLFRISNFDRFRVGASSASAGLEPLWIFFAVAGIFVLTALWLFIWHGTPQVAREHGPMENVQSVFLLVGLVMLVWHAWHEKTTAVRLLPAVMAWGYFAVLVIEFDVRPFGLKWLTLLLNGAPRNTVLAVGSVLAGACVLRHFRGVLAAGKSSGSTFITLLLVSAAFWVSGAIAEHWLPLTKPTARFLEELLETNGAWLMMLATFAGPRKKPPEAASL